MFLKLLISFLLFSYGYAKDFYVLTVPKSGTFLLIKTLQMLTNKSQVDMNWAFPGRIDAFRFIGDGDANLTFPELELAACYFFSLNQYPIGHFQFADLFEQFSLLHPQYAKIIMIRDLRDACVSEVFFQWNELRDEIGSDDFDAKLMYVITMGNTVPRNGLLNLYRNAEKAVEWLNKDAIVCRFEDLVGPEGGGTRQAQEQQIIKIALGLQVPLWPVHLEWICDNLFGKDKGPNLPTNFREGQIGSWKKYFKKEHVEAFREHMGALQVALGYSLDG